MAGRDDVSEGTAAVFEVSLSNASASPTEITLALGDAADTADTDDYDAAAMAAYYFDGGTKVELTITDGKITLPAGVTGFFVGVPTTDDEEYEGGQSFTLAAALTGGATDADTSTILDDGAGKRYDEKGIEDPGTEEDPFTPDDDSCDGTTTISGVVRQAPGGELLANVPLTLIPQGDTPGGVLMQITGEDGAFIFTGVPPGSYLLQVQDANLNSARNLYPVQSSLFFTTLEACVPQTRDFEYEFSLLPALGDYVWLDVNGNGINDEWYDANNDGLITKNIPDENGFVDYEAWEWVDLNGDNRWDGTENEGELNKGGFGNAKSANIKVTGPQDFSNNIIIGLKGYWRTRPGGDSPYGDYQVEFVLDDNFLAQAQAKSETGKVKPIPVNTPDAKVVSQTDFTPTQITSDNAKFVCGIPGGPVRTVNVTELERIRLDLDIGLVCYMSAPAFVNSFTVNEASPYAIFTVTGTATHFVSLKLEDGVADADDYGPSIDYWNGLTWIPYDPTLNDGFVTIPNGGTLLVRVSITQDDIAEGDHEFSLVVTTKTDDIATGVATINDFGEGTIFTDGDPDMVDGKPNAPVNEEQQPDDDRVLTVSGNNYNEKSPRAIFIVDATKGLVLEFETEDASNPENEPPLKPTTNMALAQMYYSTNGGQTWQKYERPTQKRADDEQQAIQASQVTAGDVPVLVAVDITAERDGIFEGKEEFKFYARTLGTLIGAGYATISDDGTGIITGEIDENTTNYDGSNLVDVERDDDRNVTVTDVNVNEASPYAVFSVQSNLGLQVRFELMDVTAGSDDYGPTLDINVGTGWIAYDPVANGGFIDVPEGGLILVRTNIIQDSEYEVSETFTLVATLNSGGSVGTGTATIFDNGEGDVYDEDGNIDPSAPKDNDSTVSVNNIVVNEASPFGIFTLSGTNGQEITLEVAGQTATLGVDFIQRIDIYQNGAWITYTSGSPVIFGSSGILLVRVPILQDADYEGSETFKLNVTTSQNQSVSGTATIKDDGTGSIWLPSNTTGEPEDVDSPDYDGPRLDDDRPITVSNIKVNESSPFAVFTVKGAPGQMVTFELVDGLADTNDYLPTIEYWDGEKWTPYGGGYIPLPSTGTLLVRNPIISDDEYEGDHEFYLSVASAGGNTFKGKATISDAGQGQVFPDAPPTVDPTLGLIPHVDRTADLDDDRPFTPLVAVDDMVSLDASNGSEAGKELINVLDNDTFGGELLVNRQAFRIELIDASDMGVMILNTENGLVTLGEVTSGGEFTLVYRLCEIERPENCSTATVTLKLTLEVTMKVSDVMGNVWYDYLEDGVWQHQFKVDADKNPALEYPLEGWNVSLVGRDIRGNLVSLATTTSADGTYLFRDIPEGIYRISKESRNAWVPVLPLLLDESPWVHYHTVRVRGDYAGDAWNNVVEPIGNRKGWLKDVKQGSGDMYASAYLHLDTDMDGVADGTVFVSGPVAVQWTNATSNELSMQITHIDLVGDSKQFGLVELSTSYFTNQAGSREITSRVFSESGDSLAFSTLTFPFKMRVGGQTWRMPDDQAPILHGRISQLLPYNQRHGMLPGVGADLVTDAGRKVARLVGMEFMPHYGVDFSANQSVFGSASGGSYAVTMEQGGARHVVSPNKADMGPTLGGGIDDSQMFVRNRQTNPSLSESKPTAVNAGVNILSSVVRGQQVQVEVVANRPAYLYAWVDFNKNGTWEESEQIFDAKLVAQGPNTISFKVPDNTSSGQTWSRFRICDCPFGLQPVGVVSGGEVEDHPVTILSAGGTVSGTVWQDANSDGIRGEDDKPMPGVTVFADLNANGSADSGEPRAMTDSQGRYTLTGVPDGTVRIMPNLDAGWQTTNLAGPSFRDVAVPENGVVSGVDFGLGRLSTNLDEDDALPTAFKLHGNYPNPFNPTTTLSFDLPEASEVRIQVVDALGRLVMDVDAGRISSGVNRTVSLDASKLASGVYMYRMLVKGSSATSVATNKFTLIK